MPSTTPRHAVRRAASVLAAGLALAVAPTLAYAGVTPGSFTDSADPGGTFNVTKTLTTPVIPPKPDIVLVVDSTGSMGSAINNVKAEMTNIVTTVKTAQAEAQFAVVNYRDAGDGAAVFTRNTDLTGDTAAAQAAVNAIGAGGGGDEPEAQLNALWEIGNGGDQISFRSGSSRIVVWFGDAPGHDPSLGHSEAAATASLTDVSAQVLAISVGANRLDLTGQAARITAATGGSLLTGIPATGLSDAILSGLSNLPVDVSWTTTCDTGLSVAFDKTSPQTVTGGEDVVLVETITVASDAAQGATLGCSTEFLINDVSAGEDYTQTVSITVNDVTDPTIACGPGVNPAGATPGGWAKAGFFQLVADDNLPGVMVTVTDNVTGTTFGPYDPDTYIKLTQAVGTAESTATEFEGAVDWHFLFAGDATITATDAAGNTATATCSVPPNKK